jgi:oligopeptide/dipeptide ABC transporter ATP-binding protein
MSLPEAVPAEPAAPRSRRLVPARLRTPLGLAALCCVVGVLALAIVAPPIWGHAAAAYHPLQVSEKPSAAHLVGTDSAGRDIFLRVLVATRLSVELTLLATAIAVTVGVLLGSLPSVTGPRVGRFVSSVVSTAVAFPSLLLAIFFATIFGVGATGAVLALGLAGGPWFARLTQTLAASVDGRDFVHAARVLGVGRVRVLVRHILPNIAEPLAINTTIGAAANLLAFAGLSFLGLGVQPPGYDWGRLLNEGLDSVYVNPWAALAPGVAIVVTGLAFNLAGELAAQAIARRRPNSSVHAPAQPGAGTAADSAGTATDSGDGAGLLLDVRGLTVQFPTADGWSTPVRGVDLQLRPDESVGVVGESGSGKSLTALAVARLVEEPALVTAQRLTFNGQNLLGIGGRRLREQLGGTLAVIFQDPMSSLNPVLRVGRQLAEVGTTHQRLDRRAAWRRAVQQLAAVRIPSARARARQLPHEFSGGMRQRAMIAIGLMGTPRLLIADEPTTALDVTVQRDVLELLSRVRAESGASLLMISHDIAVIAGMCDRVLVMYAGRVVEELPADGLRTRAQHPYTRALLRALPDMATPVDEPLVTIPGRPPRPDRLPTGCAFAARCEFAGDRCRSEDPSLQDTGVAGHRVACWYPQHEVAATGVGPVAEGAHR